ncbi:MAG: Altered inheritance of mitochondria protein 24, mitochondrial [Alectoria sarmentosa]|nr:MAG: Altered inheritance of mitochondria protein 24, mitochondrial [Alectoria sarmentosa]
MRAPLRGTEILKSSCSRAPTVCHSSTAIWRRGLHISTLSADALDILPSEPAPSTSGATPDAKFEVIGSPFSLLSVSLSASQNLYTRKGSLVGVGGKAENAVSTLSILEPFRRAFLRIPFLYQRISSTTPITALISTKASHTSMTTVNLDGTLDWMIGGKALLAWTGQTLSITPSGDRNMSLAHWGNSHVTGRGLLALAGQGSIFQVVLQAGESYVVHPSNVAAYSMNANPPLPYRLKSSTLRFQIPEIGVSKLLPDTRFIRAMRDSRTWQLFATMLFKVRTWARVTIWGDRTRAARIRDVLTSENVNEIADAQPTLLHGGGQIDPPDKPKASFPVVIKAPRMKTASIGTNGKVTFEPIGEFEKA